MAYGTVFTLGGISFNSGPDVNGVDWISDIPRGWESSEASVQLLDYVTADGQVAIGRRRSSRALVISDATAIAPTNAAMWAARNQLEALADSLLVTNGILQVNEPGGAKTLSVLHVGRMSIEIRNAVAFRFSLPLLAPKPAKVAV